MRHQNFAWTLAGLLFLLFVGCTVATQDQLVAQTADEALPEATPDPETVEVEQTAAAEDEPSPRRQAAELLEKATRAYQRVTALEDRVDVVIRRGDATTQERYVYRLGGAINAELTGPRVAAAAKNGKLYITKNTIARKYLETELVDSGAKTPHPGLLARLAGLVGYDDVPPLLPIDMRAALGLNRYMAMLRNGRLGKLEVESVGETQSARGSMVHEIVFRADNGRAVMLVRPETHFLISIQLEVDSGPDAGYQMTAAFNPEILDSFVGLIQFDPAGRKRVTELEDLRPTRMEVGEQIPELLVPTLDGRSLSIGALRGASAIFFFWSTDCDACPGNLETAERLVEWASGQPVAVRILAVNTLEDFSQAETVRGVVDKAVQDAGFSQLVLADWNHELFISLGLTELPVVVAVDAEGKLRAFLDGTAPDLLEQLKQTVLEIDPDDS